MSITDIRFLACEPFTLKEEGGNSDDAHDPGGRTHDGIIQRECDAWRKAHDEPLIDVYTLSDAERDEIYYAQYWLPNCPNVPPGLDLCLFDDGVNTGPVEAVKFLQTALGVTADGHFGVITAGALKAAPSIPRLIVAFTAAREAYYRSLRTFRYFGKDWIGRSQRCEAAALKMASGA